jgi:hypothetical protein
MIKGAAFRSDVSPLLQLYKVSADIIVSGLQCPLGFFSLGDFRLSVNFAFSCYMVYPSGRVRVSAPAIILMLVLRGRIY